jgi:hypothetical protein
MDRTLLRAGLCGGILSVSLPLMAQSAGGQGNTVVAKAPTAPTKPDLPPSAIGHTHYLDFKNGFRGIPFGTPIGEFGQVTLVREVGPVKLYRRDAENLTLGDVQLSDAIHQFISGKYMGVSLYAKGRVNSGALQRLLEAAFGPGASSHRGTNELFWRGRVANARFSLDREKGDAEGWIANNALEGAFDEYQRQTVTKAAGEL